MSEKTEQNQFIENNITLKSDEAEVDFESRLLHCNSHSSHLTVLRYLHGGKSADEFIEEFNSLTYEELCQQSVCSKKDFLAYLKTIEDEGN